MQLTIEHLDNGVKKLALKGRMDIEGTDQISLRLATETSLERANVIVDLSELEFMASVGIGNLVRSYKTLKLRGGNMVFLNPQKVVELVIEHTQVHTLIPIYHDLAAACEAVLQRAPRP